MTMDVYPDRKIRIARLVYLSVLEAAEQGGLPEDIPCFLTLVRQYCARVEPDVTRDEVIEIITTPMSELFLKGMVIG